MQCSAVQGWGHFVGEEGRAGGPCGPGGRAPTTDPAADAAWELRKVTAESVMPLWMEERPSGCREASGMKAGSRERGHTTVAWRMDRGRDRGEAHRRGAGGARRRRAATPPAPARTLRPDGFAEGSAPRSGRGEPGTPPGFGDDVTEALDMLG